MCGKTRWADDQRQDDGARFFRGLQKRRQLASGDEIRCEEVGADQQHCSACARNCSPDFLLPQVSRAEPRVIPDLERKSSVSLQGRQVRTDPHQPLRVVVAVADEDADPAWTRSVRLSGHASPRAEGPAGTGDPGRTGREAPACRSPPVSASFRRYTRSFTRAAGVAPPFAAAKSRAYASLVKRKKQR